MGKYNRGSQPLIRWRMTAMLCATAMVIPAHTGIRPSPPREEGRGLGPIPTTLHSTQMHEQHRDVGGRHAGNPRRLADRGRAKATQLFLRFRA